MRMTEDLSDFTRHGYCGFMKLKNWNCIRPSGIYPERYGTNLELLTLFHSYCRPSFTYLALFSDLQLQSLSSLHDVAKGNLEVAIHEAGLGRKAGKEVFTIRNITINKQPSVDYDKVTRGLLRNFHDSGYLMQAMLRSQSQVTKVLARRRWTKSKRISRPCIAYELSNIQIQPQAIATASQKKHS